MSRTLVFAVIAMREVEFFAAVAQALKSEDPGIGDLLHLVLPAGQPAVAGAWFPLFRPVRRPGIERPVPDMRRIRQLEQRYGIDNLHRLLIHEKLTHGQVRRRQAAGEIRRLS